MKMESIRQTGADGPGEKGGKPQVGALCWRPHGRSVEVLLITSRDTGRWVIPKGGLIEGLDAPFSARQEAWEEAGVEGHLSAPGALGSYDYDKLDRKRSLARRCRVEVYPLRVDRLLSDFPERAERRRKWFRPARAAEAVDEPGLRLMLLALSQDHSALSGA